MDQEPRVDDAVVESDSDAPEIFDFLYLDRERIAAYIAQFDDLGVLVQTRKTGTTAKTDTKGGTVGVPSVAGISLGGGATLSTSIDRQYDARYSVPLNLIDELDAAGFIETNIQAAPIGSIVLLRGSLQITDVRTLKQLWKPVISFNLQQQFPAHLLEQKFETKGRSSTEIAKIRELRQAQTNAKMERDAVTKNFEALQELVTGLPHPLQMSIFAPGLEAWATLEPAHMTVNVEGIALMHGTWVAGEWLTIAIVDATPENDVATTNPFAALGESPTVAQAMGAMQEMMRTQFGRPRTAFGISPIAIYRAVQRKGSSEGAASRAPECPEEDK